jgi:hypothetical protein
VTARLSKVPIRGTLRHQIRAAAVQLVERRQAVRLRRAALGERLHASLTSPDMLLFAAGTGFVIGEFTGQAGPVPDAKDPQQSGRRSMARVKAALRFAFEMFTLAHAATAAMAVPRKGQNGP